MYVAKSDGGYRVRLREYGRHGAGRDGSERDVTARSVFVCAGALGTTELLLRSRDQFATLPDLPAGLGQGYSGTGDFLSFGRGMRDRFEPGSGPTITTASLMHTQTAGEDHWFVLEDGGFSGHLAKLVADLDMSQLPEHVTQAIRRGALRTITRAREFAAGLDDNNVDTAVLLAMGRDRAQGRIELRGRQHRLHVTWDVSSNNPLYTAERAVSANMVRATGGQPFVTPTWALFRQPVTVHNLGGARMGTEPGIAVVDPDGEVFGHPGLYVLDGAALPSATGANPSLTIAAVAERCMEVAVRRLTGSSAWVAPERGAAEPREVPEDAVVRAVSARAGPRRLVPGISFTETMRGQGAVARRGWASTSATTRDAAPACSYTGSAGVPRRPGPRRAASWDDPCRRTDAAAGPGRRYNPAPDGCGRRRSPPNDGLHRPVHRRRRDAVAAPGVQADRAPVAQRPVARHHSVVLRDRPARVPL